ncbi:MAG: hypothetical protein V7607_5010 [Solirubrobacteraceae bacterium]
MRDGDATAGHETGVSLLDVRGLSVEFPLGLGRGVLRAVDDVTFTIRVGETVGLVGESGSGKSTIGRVVLGLTSPTTGSVRFDDAEITTATRHDRRALSAQLQVVFQDPYSSLNPTRTIGQTLAEMLRPHPGHGPEDVAQRVGGLLERVGLPAEAASRYPSQFSGGQRQRIAIARALMVGPRLIICDEAVSALDLSVQAQVLNLLHELQSEFELSYLFIAHDLAVVRHVSHRIIVLYRGRVMEQGPAPAVYGRPAHPYTRALLDAVPTLDPEIQRRRRQARTTRIGDLPAEAPGESCPFAPRCRHVVDICHSARPVLERTPENSVVACHRWRELRNDAAQDLVPSRLDAARTPGSPRD